MWWWEARSLSWKERGSSLLWARSLNLGNGERREPVISSRTSQKVYPHLLIAVCSNVYAWNNTSNDLYSERSLSVRHSWCSLTILWKLHYPVWHSVCDYVGWFIKCITHITAGSSLHFHWTLWIIKWPKYNDILICSVSFISIVLERKISTRQTREELIRKGVLIPDQGEILNKLNVILSKHGWPLTISVILKQCSRPGVPNPAPGDRLSCKVQLQL